MIVCYRCRKPAAIALSAKGGYADGPRPVCRNCYDADDYTRNRFAARPISWVNPPPWLKSWTVAHRPRGGRP